MTDSIHVIPFMTYTGQAASRGFGASHLVTAPKAPAREAGKTAVRTEKNSRRASRPQAGTKRESSRKVSARTRLQMRRRAMALRRLFLITTTLIILMGALLFTSHTVRAQEPADTTSKYYESISVAYGENIYTILETYRDSVHYKDVDSYIKEVCAINHFEYTEGELIDVRPGDRLIVPYYR